ncbi:hypothetical protein Syun_014082 [Stephania yunnanensis]|uniref:Uncharacterized protein n=1 Tax=Stephania yunnanensis TaxID=152371 RepID=A0AAP0P8F3_9MAGN
MGRESSDLCPSPLQRPGPGSGCKLGQLRFAKIVKIILIPHIIVPIIHSMRIITILAMHRHDPISLGSCQTHRFLNMKEINSFIKASPWKICMTVEEELCSTQPIFNPEEDASVDTLRSFEVNEITQVEDYLRETSEEREVFQIEPEIVIALNKGGNEMEIDVILDKPEKPQIESEEDQPLVLVQPPTLSYTFGTPYNGGEVKEHSQIFYTVDTFVLDDLDAIDSFVLEVQNELINLKEGVHASLPKYVDAPFVFDISK